MPYQLSPSLRHTRIDHEGVVLLQEAGEVLVLNDLAMRIVELLDEPIELERLLDRLQAEYATDRATLEQDLVPFIEELTATGVVEPP